MSDMNGDITTMQSMQGREQQPLATKEPSRNIRTQSSGTQKLADLPSPVTKQSHPNRMHHIASICSCLADQCPNVRNAMLMVLSTSSTVTLVFHLQWIAWCLCKNYYPESGFWVVENQLKFNETWPLVDPPCVRNTSLEGSSLID